MSLNAWERESVVNSNDSGDPTTIFTAQIKYINRLKKHPRVTLISEGNDDGTAWATFSIPSDQWSPLTGIKRNSAPVSEERKAALKAQLERGRIN